MTHFVAQGVRKPAQGVRKPAQGVRKLAPAGAGEGGRSQAVNNFCRRRSVKVVVDVVGTNFIFKFFKKYEKIYKITFLDISDVMNCANFGTSVTSTFCKNC